MGGKNMKKNIIVLIIVSILALVGAFYAAEAVDVPAYLKHSSEKRALEAQNAKTAEAAKEAENICLELTKVSGYKPAFCSLKGINGFSDRLLEEHIKIYVDNVINTNALFKKLKEQNQKSVYAELSMSLGREFTGMKLHELYFSNLGGTQALDKKSDLYKKMCEEYGSFGCWKDDFITMGMTRGEGWVILYRDKQTGIIFNSWVNEYEGGLMIECDPLLVMDVFDHAYVLDFGSDREKYIKVFMDNINWNEVNKRYSKK
jgi:superoxide dismutase, Fe-Mn family